MNRKQLPWSVKKLVVERVLSEEWTAQEAAEAVGYSLQSIRRWVDSVGLVAAAQEGLEAGRSRPEPCRVAAPEVGSELRDLLDGIMLRRPWMRRRSLQQYLRRHHGMEVNRRVLSAYLREKGLVGPVEVEDGSTGPPRRFEAAAPLDLVQVDLFYIRRQGGGFFYGLTVLDDHSRMALDVRVLEEQTGDEVLAAFCGVVERWRRPGRVLTDRGTQFYAWKGRTEFQDYVEDELWATHLIASSKHPQTLGKVERFHRTLRKEALTRKEGYPTREEAQRVLDHYLAWYNYVRPHQALEGLTPADRFYGLARPLREAMRADAGWTPERGLFAALNLAGRRLVIAAEGAGTVQVLWDDEMEGAGQSPGAGAGAVQLPAAVSCLAP